MNNANQVHPIEFFIACIINLIEFIAWTINEIAGHHTTTATAPAPQPAEPIINTDTHRIPELDALLIQEDEPMSVTSKRIFSLEGAAQAYPTDHWTEYVRQLTVRQLRQLTGKTNSRFNKASLQYIALCM